MIVLKIACLKILILVNILTNLMGSFRCCNVAVFPLFLLVGSVCNKTKTELHGRVVRIWNTFFWHLALPLKWIPREGRRVDYLPHTTLHFLLL